MNVARLLVLLGIVCVLENSRVVCASRSLRPQNPAAFVSDESSDDPEESNDDPEETDHPEDDEGSKPADEQEEPSADKAEPLGDETDDYDQTMKDLSECPSIFSDYEDIIKEAQQRVRNECSKKMTKERAEQIKKSVKHVEEQSGEGFKKALKNVEEQSEKVRQGASEKAAEAKAKLEKLEHRESAGEEKDGDESECFSWWPFCDSLSMHQNKPDEEIEVDEGLKEGLVQCNDILQNVELDKVRQDDVPMVKEAQSGLRDLKRHKKRLARLARCKGN
jgi:hypothetical protein